MTNVPIVTALSVTIRVRQNLSSHCRQRVKITPDISLHLGKCGASLSFGRRGTRITISRNRVRQTIGVPGTGFSYTVTFSYRQRQRRGKRQI